MLLQISSKRAAKAEAKNDKPAAFEGPETSMTGDIATKRTNNSKAWTSAEDERLRQLVISNASLSDIAEDLGRTASAVRARAHAMRIALRRSRFIMKRKAK